MKLRKICSLHWRLRRLQNVRNVPWLKFRKVQWLWSKRIGSVVKGSKSNHLLSQSWPTCEWCCYKLDYVKPYSHHVEVVLLFWHSVFCCLLPLVNPQWGAADAEIKVPSGENTELKRSPFQAWSRSVYSHTCYAYCQGFLPCLFLPFQSIHLHVFPNLSQFFPVLACRIK